MNARTSLAAGNYRFDVSDKVQLNSCAANGPQQSVNRELQFFRNFVPQIPEKNNERK